MNLNEVFGWSSQQSQDDQQAKQAETRQLNRFKAQQQDVQNLKQLVLTFVQANPQMAQQLAGLLTAKAPEPTVNPVEKSLSGARDLQARQAPQIPTGGQHQLQLLPKVYQQPQGQQQLSLVPKESVLEALIAWGRNKNLQRARKPSYELLKKWGMIKKGQPMQAPTQINQQQAVDAINQLIKVLQPAQRQNFARQILQSIQQQQP